MFSSTKDNALLAMIRDGREMSGSQKLNLIVQLSVPSILAQLTTIMMFYIDASMVGSLGAEASASIGIVESTTWLFGGLTGTAAGRDRSPLRFKPCAGVYCRSRASGQHYQGKAGSAAASSGDTDFH